MEAPRARLGLAARDGRDVAALLAALTPDQARAIGHAPRRRLLAAHTYDRRAHQVDTNLRARLARRRAGTPAESLA